MSAYDKARVQAVMKAEINDWKAVQASSAFLGKDDQREQARIAIVALETAMQRIEYEA